MVGLQGRFAEAESIVKADLPPDEAAANVAYLKQMLSRKDDAAQGHRNDADGVAQPSRLIVPVKAASHVVATRRNPG